MRGEQIPKEQTMMLENLPKNSSKMDESFRKKSLLNEANTN